MGQTSVKGGRPATEYWLTLESALFIVTKSETPKALALTKEMIRVFILAKQGLLGVQNDVSPSRDDRFDRIEQMLREQGRPILGPGVAKSCILDRLKQIALLEAHAIGRPDEKRRLRKIAENELRHRLGFSPQAFYSLPTVRLGEAVNVLDRMEWHVMQLAKISSRMVQLPLSFNAAANTTMKKGA